jgi:hypothetical protein
MKFCKCRNWYKKRIGIVYLENSYKNPFDRKSPATCGSSFQSSRQVGVLFCLRIFHGVACSQFRAIFHRILRLQYCFLICFEQVGRWGCMRYGRNVKGICGLGLCQLLHKNKSHGFEKSNDLSVFWVSFWCFFIVKRENEIYQKKLNFSSKFI